VGPIDLLQQLGLNKYEAHAYYTLLAEGPLTGYELGKRSQVPLSRSYEILERLTLKGLALQQPGDPPRYAAEEYPRVLGTIRRDFTQTVDALAAMLAELPRREPSGEFWVLRDRRHILARLRSMIGEAQRSLDMHLPAAYQVQLADALDVAPPGQRSWQTDGPPETDEIVLALADGRHALAGALSPTEGCQAISGGNPALVVLLREHFAAPPAAGPLQHPAAAPAPSWLEWEIRKQRQLWRLSAQARSA
jgi:hypothetical protein